MAARAHISDKLVLKSGPSIVQLFCEEIHVLFEAPLPFTFDPTYQPLTGCRELGASQTTVPSQAASGRESHMGSGGPIISETGKQCYSATVPQLRCWLQSRPGSRTAHSPLGHGWLVVTTNRPDNQSISHGPHRLQRVSCPLVENPSNSVNCQTN